jgi:hypothetical protein
MDFITYNSQSDWNVTLHANELLCLLKYHTDTSTIHVPALGSQEESTDSPPPISLVATSYMSTFPHSYQLSLVFSLSLSLSQEACRQRRHSNTLLLGTSVEGSGESES